MSGRRRLDAELVRRHLARSREDAKDLIEAGRVLVGGFVATKAARQVQDSESVTIAGGTDAWVSRGAHKLIGALDAFMPAGLVVVGRRCLDAGASTGGFTQVLLHHGATKVVAADVGYGQLHWSLQTDARVDVVDRCNVRELDLARIGGRVDLVVADLSFIGLRLVLASLIAVTEPHGDIVVMVKPQFEVGVERIGANGVVTDPQARMDAVADVAHAAAALGWGAVSVVASPLPGPAGNVEYFLWLRQGTPVVTDAMITRVVEGGPQ